MTAWTRAAGTRLAQLGEGWVAYSALSGETHLLNDESVAVLDALDTVTPRTLDAVCQWLADDLAMDPGELDAILRPSWSSLVSAGLVREAA